MKSILIRLCLVFGFVTATLFASAQNFESAIDLNDYFVSITDTLYMGGGEWGKQLKKARETKDFGSLIPARKKMEVFIDKKLEALAKMKDKFGSENLRLTTMDFLTYEKRLLQEGFIPIEKLNKNSTEEEIKKAIANLSATVKEENAEIARVNQAQEAFAEKNGFTIEKEN